MTIALDRLPFDVLFHVTSCLELDDIVHLGYTCRQLRLHLNESTLCRRTVEVCEAYAFAHIRGTNCAVGPSPS